MCYDTLRSISEVESLHWFLHFSPLILQAAIYAFFQVTNPNINPNFWLLFLLLSETCILLLLMSTSLTVFIV